MKNLTFVLFIFCTHLLVAQSWAPAGKTMRTKWAAQVAPDNVWKEYPRPQFERSEWMNLNGLWKYTLQNKSMPMPQKYLGDILVPFCIESSLSGVGKTMLPTDRLWYKREFVLPKNWTGKKVIINFDAVDWAASIWVNEALIGSHQGAYDRFSFDITPYLKGKGVQDIVVCVDDPSSSGSQPRGKQQMPQQGIWYTPVSGIWQTVWLEAVSTEGFLKEVKITPDVDQRNVSFIPMLNEPILPNYQVAITVSEAGKVLSITSVGADNKTSVAIENPKLWSPDSPFLYDVKLELKNKEGATIDVVNSYFGMRKISLGQKEGATVMFLNNQFLFHYGTLDQGWWPDGLHTAPCDEALKQDLVITKQMGFNMIRKHIKVEPDRWYFHCDKLGIMVWQDMPSGMVILPPVKPGERSINTQQVSRTGNDLFQRSENAAEFEHEMRRMIDNHYNAACIVMWVPFNEGWGQYATCRIADAIKGLDPTRLVNSASGWGLRPCGDMYDIHTYQTEVNVPAISLDRASVIGEFGGIGYPITGHLWNPEMRNWGYQTYQSADELLKNYEYKFNQIVAMKKTKALSAAVYTQTTDVEGEINGLMTYDREIIKMPVEVLKKMHSVLFEK